MQNLAILVSCMSVVMYGHVVCSIVVDYHKCIKYKPHYATYITRHCLCVHVYLPQMYEMKDLWRSSTVWLHKHRHEWTLRPHLYQVKPELSCTIQISPTKLFMFSSMCLLLVIVRWVFNILHPVYITTLLVTLAVTSAPILLACVVCYQAWSTVAGALVSVVGRRWVGYMHASLRGESHKLPESPSWSEWREMTGIACFFVCV